MHGNRTKVRLTKILTLSMQVVLSNVLVSLPRMANGILSLDHAHYMFKLVPQRGILSLCLIHYTVKLMLHWESEVKNLLTYCTAFTFFT